MLSVSYDNDRLFGTLLTHDETDSERTYFTIECEYFHFCKWMYSHGWIHVRDKPCERKGLRGYEVTLHRGGRQ
jgi:hypothetical protein